MATELFTYGIPFVFLLAVVFGALEVGGFKNKRVSILISLAIAGLAVSNAATVDFVTTIMPYAAIVFVVLFFLGFLGSFFKKQQKDKDWTLILLVGGILLILMVRFGDVFKGLLGNLPLPLDTESLFSIIAVGLFLVLLLAVYRKGEK